MIFRNIIAVLVGIPTFALASIQGGKQPQQSDKILFEVTQGLAKGQISTDMAKNLINLRLEELLNSGRLELNDFERLKINQGRGNIKGLGVSSPDDGSITGK